MGGGGGGGVVYDSSNVMASGDNEVIYTSNNIFIYVLIEYSIISLHIILIAFSSGYY